MCGLTNLVLDPLIFTLMEDPVILPASRMSIDRATIRSHLLSDPNDPFNRVPLKIEDVIPSKYFSQRVGLQYRANNHTDTALKEEIQKFKTDRVEQRRRERAQQARSEQMDTSAG